MNKKVSIGFGALALVFTGLLVIPRFVTLNSWKPQIEQQASEALGRTVHIDGNISLSVLPYPGVSLSNVRVANAEDGQHVEMISADTITVTVSLLPLIMKTLEFSQISLIKPDIHLEVSKKGKGNWELPVLAPEATDSTENVENKSQESSGWTVKKTLPRINILEGALSYTDQAGKTSHITHFQTSLKTNSVQGPFSLKGNMRVEDKDFEYDVEIGEMVKGDLVEVNAQVLGKGQKLQIIGKLDAAQKSFQGQLASKLNPSDVLGEMSPIKGDLKVTSDISASVSKVDVTKLVLKTKDFTAEGEAHVKLGDTISYSTVIGGFPGNSNIEIKSSSGKNDQLKSTASIKSENIQAFLAWVKPDLADKIEAKNLDASANLEIQGEEIRLTQLKLVLDGKKMTGDISIKMPEIKANITTPDLKPWLELAKVEAPSTIGTAKFDGQIFFKERIDIDAKLSFAGGHIKTKGNVTPLSKSYHLDLDLSYPNLPGLLKAFGTDLSTINLGAADIKLNVTGAANRISVNEFKGIMGPKGGSFSVDGTATIDLKGPKPSILSKLTLGPVNLEKILVSAVGSSENQFASVAKSKPTKNKERWSKDKIDLAFLKAIDAEIDLQIDTLGYAGISIAGFTCPIKIKNSDLNMAPIKGTLYGGALNAAGEISGGNSIKASIKSTLVNASLEKIVSSFAKNTIKGGTLDLDMQINGAGMSVADLVNSMNGHTNLTASQGSILGFDIQNIAKKIRTLTDPTALLSLFEKSSGSTPFSKIIYRSTIRKGVSNIETLRIEAPHFSGMGGGFIHLPDYKLDVYTDVSIKDLEEAPTVQVIVKGPLDNTQFDYNISALRDFLFKKVGGSLINRLIKKQSGNGVGKTGDAIGGVLGIIAPDLGKDENKNTGDESSTDQTEPSPEKAVEGLLKKLF